jgi:hypothetical protein
MALLKSEAHKWFEEKFNKRIPGKLKGVVIFPQQELQGIEFKPEEARRIIGDIGPREFAFRHVKWTGLLNRVIILRTLKRIDLEKLAGEAKKVRRWSVEFYPK